MTFVGTFVIIHGLTPLVPVRENMLSIVVALAQSSGNRDDKNWM